MGKVVTGLSLHRALLLCFCVIALLPLGVLGVWLQQQLEQQLGTRTGQQDYAIALSIAGQMERHSQQLEVVFDEVVSMLHLSNPDRGAALHQSMQAAGLVGVGLTEGEALHTLPSGGAASRGLRGLISRQFAYLSLESSHNTQFSSLFNAEPSALVGARQYLWMFKRLNNGELAVGLVRANFISELSHLPNEAGMPKVVLFNSLGQPLREQDRLIPVPDINQHAITKLEVDPFAIKLVVFRSLDDTASQLAPVRLYTTVIVFASLLLCLSLAWWFAAWLSRPLKLLSKAALNYSEGERIENPVAGKAMPAEFHQLWDSFIGMAGRIERNHQSLKFQAEHDPLTKLLNRSQAKPSIEKAVSRSNEANQPCGLLFVDLDRFKAVNDTYGHDIGDLLLNDVANRLLEAAPNMPMMRLGGDEFILVAEKTNQDTMEQMAKDILRAIEKPTLIESCRCDLSCSIGIAMSPNHGNSADELLRCADLAMYKAKADPNENIIVFSSELLAGRSRQLNIEQALRKALADETIEVHYQPRLSLLDGSTPCVEALVRFPSIDKQLGATISEIIEIAEKSGLVASLGEWVIAQAAKELSSVCNSNGQPLRLSVNLSSLQFAQRNVLSNIIKALGLANFDPHRLELEITESTLIADLQRGHTLVREIKQAGIQISIDDFGTGYSALSYLRQLPLDRIKIDGSFVRGMEKSETHSAIANTIIDLGDSLNMAITAESVENQDQLALLLAAQCDEVQGNFIAEAMPLVSLKQWLLDFDGQALLQQTAEMPIVRGAKLSTKT